MKSNEETLKIIKNMRNENINKLKGSGIFGKEIFITAKAGKTRALIYKSKLSRNYIFCFPHFQ
jgi:hypothetical protein